MRPLKKVKTHSPSQPVENQLGQTVNDLFNNIDADDIFDQPVAKVPDNDSIERIEGSNQSDGQIVEILHRNDEKNTIDVKPFTNLHRKMITDNDIQPLRTPREYAKCLKKYGYVVIPVYDENTINVKNAEFKQCLSEMPEFNHPLGLWRKEKHYVKGGFGALGNPSSFHNTFVRQVRKDAMKKVIPIFSEFRTLFGGNGIAGNLREHKLEQLIDRMRVLRPKADIMHESWHKDTTPEIYTHENDVIFGGWISFDNENAKPQKFSAFHKSHRVFPIHLDDSSERGNGSGFSKLTSEQAQELDKMKDSYMKKSGGNGWFIEIPSGHMLIFQQEMIHEVKKADSGMSEPSLRLFTAWRLTKSDNRFMQLQLPNLFTKMTVPLLKSGQKVAMWPNANWKPKVWGGLSEWSETTFKRIFLERREMKSIKESKLVIPEFFTYGMNDISIKLQAEIAIDQANIDDNEPANVHTTVAYEPPHIWRGIYGDEDLEMYGIDHNDTFYPAYDQHELSIMEPNVHWILDGQEYHL